MSGARVEFFQKSGELRFSVEKKDIKSVNINQSIDPASFELPISTVELVVKAQTQPETGDKVLTYFDGVLQSATVVKSCKLLKSGFYQIKTEDFISILNDTVFEGGVYSGETLQNLLDLITLKTGVTFESDNAGDFDDDLIRGYIPYSNCRVALQQMLFANQLFAKTSGTDTIKICRVPWGNETSLTHERVFLNYNTDMVEPYDAVGIKHFMFYPSAEEVEVLFENKTGQSIDGLTVAFGEPCNDISISNGEILDGADITGSTNKKVATNYVTINAGVGCVLYGKPYLKDEYLVSVKSGSIASKTAKIESATLLNLSNVSSVSSNSLYWLSRKTKISAEIVDRKRSIVGDYVRYGAKKYGAFVYGEKSKTEYIKDDSINVGDLVAVEFADGKTGLVQKQTYSLNGGILKKKSEIVLV